MLDVLVVDDSDLIRNMILKTMRLARVPVGAAYEAGNGREALAILGEKWVDLVLADINMPVMDGVEMVSRMRSSTELSEIPVIVVSTEGDVSRMEELRSMGVIAYVRKPFTPERLRDVIAGVTADWTQGDHEGLLIDVLQTVLEKFTFMYGEPVPKDRLPDGGDDLMLARMTFSGAIEGAMGIAAPNMLCGDMAANILGEDDGGGVPTERMADALGEVLNMACGHITSALEAETATNLSPPVVSRLARDDWERMRAATYSFGFVVEGHPVLLSLGVRAPVARA